MIFCKISQINYWFFYIRKFFRKDLTMYPILYLNMGHVNQNWLSNWEKQSGRSDSYLIYVKRIDVEFNGHLNVRTYRLLCVHFWCNSSFLFPKIRLSVPQLFLSFTLLCFPSRFQDFTFKDFPNSKVTYFSLDILS